MYLGCIWRHLNATVFNGATPMASAIKNKAKEEYDRWHLEKLFRGDVFWISRAGAPLVACKRVITFVFLRICDLLLTAENNLLWPC
jgi:hypothetical protein